MAEIRSHRDLVAWQTAFQLGLDIYTATSGFPTAERFGLVSQLRRGAVAISSNIAEGYGRGSSKDYVRYLKIARGALYEIDTQLLFAQSLGYLALDAYERLLDQLNTCGRILAGLIRSIEKGRVQG